MQSINLHTRSLGRALKSLKSLPCEGWVNLGYATTHGSNLLVGRAAVEALKEIHAVAVATRDGLDLVRAAAVEADDAVVDIARLLRRSIRAPYGQLAPVVVAKRHTVLVRDVVLILVLADDLHLAVGDHVDLNRPVAILPGKSLSTATISGASASL